MRPKLEGATLRYRPTAKGEKLDLTNVFFRCERCKKYVPAEKMGIRKMTPKSGKWRNQSHCTKCRSIKTKLEKAVAFLESRDAYYEELMDNMLELVKGLSDSAGPRPIGPEGE